MVIFEGLAPVLVGMVAGAALVLIALSVRTMSVLNQVPSADLPLLACVPLIMLAATVVACYLPARRASRINPAWALKQ